MGKFAVAKSGLMELNLPSPFPYDMKKEELIAALQEIRTGLKSDQIADNFKRAWEGQTSSEYTPFSRTVLNDLAAGTGNFPRFGPVARKLCDLLDISIYYEGKGNSSILHHMAGPRNLEGQQHESAYKKSFLSQPATLRFVEAHKRVVTTSDVINETLHAARPEGELLLEGITDGAGPTLKRVQATLATIEELTNVYCESQGEKETPTIEITYLDLGSNYQVGVKVDAKAEVGINLSRLLTEMFRCLMNPRAYIHARRAEEIFKEVEVFTDLQKKVDAGDMTAEAANAFAERLLGCGKKFIEQRVFPTSMLEEQPVASPASELLSLIDEATKPLALPAPDYGRTKEGK